MKKVCTRAVAVRKNSFADGKSLQDLKLRNQFEITVLTVSRAGKNIANPAGNFIIQPGDRLIMMGEASKFAEAAQVFRDETPPEEFIDN